MPVLCPQFSLQTLIRPNIAALKPYRCARDDYHQGILLDANENALGSALAPPGALLSSSPPLEPPPTSTGGLSLQSLSLHRYPSPLHIPIKQNLCTYHNQVHPSLTPLEPSNVFLGVGSDEVLDLLFRIVCKPGETEGIGDRILVTPPTYGMYTVCAHVNDLGILAVPLEQNFIIDPQKIIEAVISQPKERPVKMVILCSPGNPTGTTIPLETVETILSDSRFTGLVVVDEAYIDFAGHEKSALKLLRKGWQNLVVVQTLSKGSGLAGIRLGIAYASEELVQVLNKTKAPYTISTPSATLAYAATLPKALAQTRVHITQILSNRAWLASQLVKVEGMGKILGSSEANFILVEVLRNGAPDSERARAIYKYMADGGIVVRFRGDELGCRGCLRITVGTMEECEAMVERLRKALTHIP